MKKSMFVIVLTLLLTGFCMASCAGKEAPVQVSPVEKVSKALRTAAPSVAIYTVRTNGFELNGSEVMELNRIALQACYDAGLKCSLRDPETMSNLEQEKKYGAKGTIRQADYIAEFTLVGMTKDSTTVGIPTDIRIGGGYGGVGGTIYGGGGYTDLSGLGIRLSKMALTGQITNTNDGTMAFSSTKEKIGLTGSFVVGSSTSSNPKKLLGTFQEMFEEFRKKELE